MNKKAIILHAVAALALLSACAPKSGEAPTPVAATGAEKPEFCSELPRAGWAAYDRLAASDDWFEVYRLADDLYAIAEPWQWQEVISYLIIGETSALLFDSGNGIGDIRAVVDRLTRLPVTVLASHSHIDHVGGHHQFTDILAPATPFTTERAKGSDNAFAREEASAAALCKPLPAGVTEDNHHIEPFAPTARVGEGSRIDLGGTTLEVLAIPGHTPDSIALLDAARGRLFTGDTYYRGPIWLFAPETDVEAYRASIARLASLAPALSAVHGAHNEPFSAGEELVKVRDAFEAIMAGEITPAEIADGRARYEFPTFEILMQAKAQP